MANTKEGYSIAAVDVGSTKTIVIIGQVNEGLVNIVGIGKAPNSGLRRGSVVDVEETVSSISAAIEDAEKSSGFTVDSCFASVGGTQIVSVDSKGIIAVSRPDGEISAPDIDRVLEAAQSVALPPNFEILHTIPKYFGVDSQNGIKDPTGMTGVRLEVNAHIVGISMLSIKNLTKSLTQSGLDIQGVVFSPLAASKAFLNKRQMEMGVVIIDFGASSTSIAVFEESALIHSKVIPIGSNHITNDIAIGLKISLEAAEKLKIEAIDVDSANVKDSEKIDLAKYERHEKEKPSRQYVCEIAEARLNELFQMIKQELADIERDEMLPAGAVLVGGGSKLRGIVPLTKKILGLPVQEGIPVYEVSGLIDKVDDPSYATAVGLMLWGLDESQTNVSNKNRMNLNLGSVGGYFGKVKDIFKNFLP
jgi:cell division protein FtsA